MRPFHLAFPVDNLEKTREFYTKTLVKEGTSIGANATIVCGNSIGKNAFIGAGAVVINNILDYGLVVGNPAKQIGWVCECGIKLTNKLKCKSCNKEYENCTSGIQKINA